MSERLASGPTRATIGSFQESGWADAFREFTGARVLVVGGSSGIGAAVGVAFAECGARVCLHFHRHAKEAATTAAGLASRGCEVSTVGADLADPAAPQHLVASATAALGGLDILLNVAGAPLGRTTVDALDDAMLAAILQLNLNSVIAVTRAALPVLRESRYPAIVNTSSIAARSGGGRGVSVYAAAKAGVESFTRALARELGSGGIRVNCVAPGYIDTPIHDGFSSDRDRQGYLEATPMRRSGAAEECVGAYLFLASHKLASFVTGQTVAVNGGLALI